MAGSKIGGRCCARGPINHEIAAAPQQPRHLGGPPNPLNDEGGIASASQRSVSTRRGWAMCRRRDPPPRPSTPSVGAFRRCHPGPPRRIEDALNRPVGYLR